MTYFSTSPRFSRLRSAMGFGALAATLLLASPAVSQNELRTCMKGHIYGITSGDLPVGSDKLTAFTILGRGPTGELYEVQGRLTNSEQHTWNRFNRLELALRSAMLAQHWVEITSYGDCQADVTKLMVKVCTQDDCS